MNDAKLCKALLGYRRLVQTSQLQTDSQYQRPPDREKVSKLAKHPCRRPIFVNRRNDGSLWIIDGQHRALAAHQRGRQLISAYTVSVPQTDEPLLYAALNGDYEPTPTDDTSIVKAQTWLNR